MTVEDEGRPKAGRRSRTPPPVETILCCPLTFQPLVNVEDVESVRGRLGRGDLCCLNGDTVEAAFDGFLKNVSAEIYYPVREGVMILMPAFAIADEASRAGYGERMTDADTLMVMKFYDEVGWTEATSGAFIDADINEDFRNVSSRYVHDCHIRVNNHLPTGGDYIVDVASGPVQYQEYLTYSRNFARRVCCDVSFEALRLARAKLGEHGVYVQCDITNMPFKDGAVDAFVSLHTIYHVPAELQIRAFRELERITRPGSAGVVVYRWGNRSIAGKIAAAPRRAIRTATSRLRSAVRRFAPNRLVALVRRFQPRVSEDKPVRLQQAASQYCFHTHSFDWYRENLASTGCWSLHSWRCLSLRFLKERIREGTGGRMILGLIYKLESAFPAFFGRIGQYPMFVFKKPNFTKFLNTQEYK